MKTLETVVYDFMELTTIAKEKAIAEYYEHEDYPFLTDDLTEELKRLDYIGLFSNIKLRYSLSYSKGDGLSFSGNIDLTKWLNNRNMKVSVSDIIYNSIYSLKAGSNHSCFALRDDIECEYENLPKRLDKVMNVIVDEVRDYYMDICHELYKYGYSIIDYRMNEKEFNELCLDMDYSFLPDGTMKNK